MVGNNMEKLDIKGNLLMKKDLAEQPRNCVIKGVNKNQFGKQVLEVELDGQLRVITLNNADKMQLVNAFGENWENLGSGKCSLSATKKGQFNGFDIYQLVITK